MAVLTVQLEHTLPDGSRHIDWMIAHDEGGEGPLTTFRLERRIDGIPRGVQVRGERLGDHRPVYLTYEGEVSGGRGSVRRVGEGTASSVEVDGARVEVVVDWGRGPERIVGERGNEGVWTFESRA